MDDSITSIYKTPVAVQVFVVQHLPPDVLKKLLPGSPWLRQISIKEKYRENLQLSQISKGKIVPRGTLLYMAARDEDIKHYITWYMLNPEKSYETAGSCAEERGYVHVFVARTDINCGLLDQSHADMVLFDNSIVQSDVCSRYDGLFLDFGERNSKFNEVALCTSARFLDYKESRVCGTKEVIVLPGISEGFSKNPQRSGYVSNLRPAMKVTLKTVGPGSVVTPTEPGVPAEPEVSENTPHNVVTIIRGDNDDVSKWAVDFIKKFQKKHPVDYRIIDTVSDEDRKVKLAEANRYTFPLVYQDSLDKAGNLISRELMGKTGSFQDMIEVLPTFFQ